MCFEVAHAIGFSQWLMTDFHERRIHSAFGDLGGRTLKSVRGAECGVQSLNTEFFRQCRSTALQKTIRYSPLAIHCRFGFNWRVVLPHDRNLNKFGCSGEQPSSFVPARPKFFRHGRAVPSRKTIRHSLFATRCRFGSAGALPSQFIPSPVPRPAPRFKSVATKNEACYLSCALRVESLGLGLFL
jgi:hypothetical protein